MLGAEFHHANASQFQYFRSQTGATFPILTLAGDAAGGNMFPPYGERDNYIVINKQGIVRFNTYPKYSYGEAWHVEEIRGCIDSLISSSVSVDPAGSRALSLSSHPNPFRHTSAVELVLPERAREARVGVFDLSGRLIRSLVEGDLPAGTHRWTWDGRTNQGERARAGIYLIRAAVDGRNLSRRITRLE